MDKKFMAFINQITNKLQDNLGEEYQIEMKEIQGINNTVKHSLLLIHPDRDIHPCIHLNPYYEQYKSGVKIDCLVKGILESCKEAYGSRLPSVSNFTSWENVKLYVYAKLIHTEKNHSLLSKIPNRAFLDLSLVYYVRRENMVNEECAMTQISNDHMSYWNIDENTLYQTAWKNTINPNEASIKNIEDILRPFFCIKEIRNIDMGEELQMYVLSNRYHLNGAVQMCNHNLLQKIAKVMGDDLWILPASVHEVILIPICQTEGCAEGLAEIVKEINDTQVSQHEILSYHIYCYSRKSGETLIAV